MPTQPEYFPFLPHPRPPPPPLYSYPNPLPVCLPPHWSAITSSYSHTSIARNAVSCRSSSNPPSSVLFHSLWTKIELKPRASSIILVMIDSSCTVSTSLEPNPLLRIDAHIAFSFALINCRYILNNFGHLRRFDGSSNIDIPFVTESWLNEDTLNRVTSLASYQSFRGTGNDCRGAGCFFYVR